MAILTFTRKQAETLMQASLQNNCALHLVKDDGVYAMVWGADGEPNIVQYAKGLNPKTDKDVHAKACNKLGYDDLDEPLGDQSSFFKKVLANTQWNVFRIHVTVNHIKMSLTT